MHTVRGSENRDEERKKNARSRVRRRERTSDVIYHLGSARNQVGPMVGSCLCPWSRADKIKFANNIVSEEKKRSCFYGLTHWDGKWTTNLPTQTLHKVE